MTRPTKGAFVRRERFGWKIRVFVLGAISVASSLVAATGRYLLWLDYRDDLGRQFVLVCAFAVAVISTAAWVLLQRRGGGGMKGRVAGYVMVVLIAAIALLPWNGIFARTWFAANHGKFAFLADMAEKRELHTDSSHASGRERRYGFGVTFGHGYQDEPVEVAPGRVLMLGMSYEEVPENMYLYIYGRPDAARLNPCRLKETTFADHYRCTRLGDGWWWLSG